MSRESEHTCHALRCEVHVPPSMFMCKKHWMKLPRVMRGAVWRHYVPGQEDRMDPTMEYMSVTGRAIRWLAIEEGHIEPVAG
jgi:hypothetical protein